MTGKERGVYAASSLVNRWANRFVAVGNQHRSGLNAARPVGPCQDSTLGRDPEFRLPNPQAAPNFNINEMSSVQ